MIHVETTDRHVRQSSHRTIDGAIVAAERIAPHCGGVVRLAVDSSTLAALLASGAAYRTEGGELVDRSRRTTLVSL